jgi:hypothetical protein
MKLGRFFVLFRDLVAITLILVVISVRNSSAQECRNVINLSHEDGTPFVQAPVFPSIGYSRTDPFREIYPKKFTPNAELIWRYINSFTKHEKIKYSEYSAFRINAINSIYELPGHKAIYVPFSVSEVFKYGQIDNEHVEMASKAYLDKLVNSGEKVIISHPVNKIESDMPLVIVNISTVIPNVSDDNSLANALAVSFFSVTTGLRIDRMKTFSSKFLTEMADGCLDGRSRKCRILDIGKKVMKLRNTWTNPSNAQLQSQICETR